MNKAEKYLKVIVNGHFIRKEKHEKAFKEKEKLVEMITGMLDKNTKGHYGDCVLVKEIDSIARILTANILAEFIIIIDKGVVK